MSRYVAFIEINNIVLAIIHFENIKLSPKIVPFSRVLLLIFIKLVV
jgi:hypothetical protein